MNKILLIEDDPHLSSTVKQHLLNAGYVVDVAFDGNNGLEMALQGYYNAIILDVMLPGIDGMKVVSEIRKNGMSVPVIMVTAKSGIDDRIDGLQAGADDYLPKPFSPRELIARLEALIRRANNTTMRKSSLEFGDLKLNAESCILSCGDSKIKLGDKECELLKCLMGDPGSPHSKDELASRVWENPSSLGNIDGNVEVYVSFIRKKLSFLSSGVSIKSIRKIGYILEYDEVM